MSAYGAWRYAIEFLRGDYRGQIFTNAISPSQFIALLMVMGGVALFFFERYYTKKHKSEIDSDAMAILEMRRKREEEKSAPDADKDSEATES